MTNALLLNDLQACVELIKTSQKWTENCYAILYLDRSKTISALEESKVSSENRVKSILQDLEKLKNSQDGLSSRVSNKKIEYQNAQSIVTASEVKLTEADINVSSKQQVLDAATIEFNQAVLAYNNQKKYIDDCDNRGIVKTSLSSDMRFEYCYPYLTIATIPTRYAPQICGNYDRVTNFQIRSKEEITEFRIVEVGFRNWFWIKVNGHTVYVGPRGGSYVEGFFNNNMPIVRNGQGEYGCDNNLQCYGVWGGGVWVKCDDTNTRHSRFRLGTEYVQKPDFKFNLDIDLKPYLKEGDNDIWMRVIVSRPGVGVDAWMKTIAKQNVCMNWQERGSEQCQTNAINSQVRTQAQTDLNHQNLDKNIKEQLKIQANTELQNTLALKDQAQTDLNLAKQKAEQIYVELQTLESQNNAVDLKTHESDQSIAQQELSIITELLAQIPEIILQKQAELERIIAQKAEEELLAMDDALHCQVDYLGVLSGRQQTEDIPAIIGDVDHEKSEYL